MIDFYSQLPESYEINDIKDGLINLINLILEDGTLPQDKLGVMARLKAKIEIELK